MCGIAALVGLEGRKVDAAALDRMASSLQHRGPDDKGVYIKGSIGFGFRRLSILDLSPSGHQPKVSHDGKKILVFNGEIYNYIELREELRALGHQFESTGDTEVLLAAYSEWGKDCLSKLNGMWAFLIYDITEGKIFGSRDRFGVKPLYRYSSSDLMLFGSEIKAILHSGYYKTEINFEVAARFLIEGELDVDNMTFYKGIEQIPAGSAFELHLDGRYNTWFYWSLDDIKPDEPAHPCETFKQLFDDAVRLRMRSDVPVGVCLSGGLDSTSILCSMSRLKTDSSSPLEAFSFISKDYDESKYIADTIQLTGAHLNRLEVNTAVLVNKLEKVLWYHDEPVHSMTALVGFELMGLAAQAGVKVILNGQGADETIAGYHSFFGAHWGGMLRKGKFLPAWSEIKEHSSILGSDRYMLFISSVLSVLCDRVSKASLYRKAAAYKYRKTLNRTSWFTPEFFSYLKVERAPRILALEDALKVSIQRHPLPLFLRIEDRNSMAHSVEARLPFLDYRLVTFLFALSAEWKMRGPWNKYILRHSMAGMIPESVRTRSDKMGFPVPSKQWMTEAFYAPMKDLLGNREMRESGLYNLRNLNKDLELQRQGGKDFSTPMFNITQFQLWSNLQQVHKSNPLS
jgi:asparagine synthase (glutamine-hydrolysing)